MKNEEKIVSPLKAIRMNCLECCGCEYEVGLCSHIDCVFHLFRFGKNPNRTGRKLTEEEKQKRAEQLRAARKPK